MELHEYQERAMTTCMESSNNFAYMFDNLLGEVGEFALKVYDITKEHNDNATIGDLRDTAKRLLGYGGIAKKIRKEVKEMVITAELNNYNKTVVAAIASNEDLKKELGDIIWQLSGVCHVLGISLEDIANDNLAKLADRKKRDQIDGDGDNR